MRHLLKLVERHEKLLWKAAVKCVKFSIYFSWKISCIFPVMIIEMSTLLVSFGKSQERCVLYNCLVLSCFCATNVLQFDHTCVNFLLSKNKSRYQLQKISLLTLICQLFWHRNVIEIFNTSAFIYIYIYIYSTTMMFEKINMPG